MVKKNVLIAIMACFTFILACSKDENDKEFFNVKNYHQSFVDDIIIPSTTDLVTNTKTLNDAIIDFTSTINETNLSTLRNAWKNTAISFSKAEIGNLGDVQNLAIYLSIYSWGANEDKIEEFIASTTTISDNDVNSLPTKARGLSAIEYLIFENDIPTTIASFSNQRRNDFLSVLGKNVTEKVNLLDTQWKNYSNNFINNTSTGINGSINFIVNQMNFLLENVRRFKIGEPAGLENSSTIDVTLLQADKSRISLALIKENIASIKSAYYGNTEGLDDYVRTIATNEDVNDAINKAFFDIENNITSLSNTTLKNAIEANDSIVSQLHNNIKDLIILIKVDVASILSVTVTFTDNDGDS